MVGEHTIGQQPDEQFLHSVITEALRFISHIDRFVVSFEFEPIFLSLNLLILIDELCLFHDIFMMCSLHVTQYLKDNLYSLFIMRPLVRAISSPSPKQNKHKKTYCARTFFMEHVLEGHQRYGGIIRQYC